MKDQSEPDEDGGESLRERARLRGSTSGWRSAQVPSNCRDNVGVLRRLRYSQDASSSPGNDLVEELPPRLASFQLPGSKLSPSLNYFPKEKEKVF
ncbi:hypothetical protein KQX54_018605 [Cotesia glomerata]|uniref:Uncharacterized protein n=1 Tax=Cotesia glomerata TaxID=32391 RepID=A0AAV7HZD1_COTGL|nr:hypothetical protein KQX54_018605 [Cotesia glomerata]